VSEPENGPTEGAYGIATRVLSSVMVGLGVLMVVSTLIRGGGPFAVGVIFGVLFAAAGAARLYLVHRQAEDG
jgi:hypothetical protein